MKESIINKIIGRHGLSVSLLVLSLLVYGTAFAASDKTMNWCGWRTNTTFTTASPYVAKNLRDLDTFRNWFGKTGLTCFATSPGRLVVGPYRW